MSTRKILVVCGPTAVGKTAFSLDLARERNGRILCMDAFQIYSGMDILTASPDAKEKLVAEHELFGIRSPLESFSLANYYELAVQAIGKCFEDGKTPILVGGTGLYLKSLRDGLEDSAVEPNPEFRKKMEALADEKGSQALHDLLKECWPERAIKLHPNDRKRLIRALEIQKFSKGEQQRRDDLKSFCAQFESYCLQTKREELYNRVNKRVDRMLEAGLIEEVEGLLKQGVSRGMTSFQAIGLKETASYLQNEISYEEFVELLKRNTRRFAKRQLTWWRSLPGLTFLEAKG